MSFPFQYMWYLPTLSFQLYTRASSILKFAQLRQAKEARENYCLDCLVSLVEQASCF